MTVDRDTDLFVRTMGADPGPWRLKFGRWVRGVAMWRVIRGLIGCAVAVLMGAATTPAASAGTLLVTVHLQVDVTPEVVSLGVPVNLVHCDVRVRASSDGIAVLAAAKKTACVSSYTTRGARILCINRLCEDDAGFVPATEWLAYGDGAYPYPGQAGDFRATPGGTLSFQYTNFMLD